jgi:hypothetical protein
MAVRPKSPRRWRDKRDSEQAAKVVDIPPRMQKQWGRGTMVVARPKDVDALMKKPRKGRLTTVKQIMAQVAKQHGADTACPMTTGIFVRIAAEAAEEELAEGRKRVTPYWRTLKADGRLNPKYPGGVQAQARRLRAEGHVIEKARGKQPPRVEDYESKLVTL